METETAVERNLLDITRERREEEIKNALFDISNAVNTVPNLQDLYSSIHLSLGRIMDATNFFIALLDIRECTLHYPYHVDTMDDDFSPTVDFDTRHSLTGLVAVKKRSILIKKKELEKRAAQKGIRGTLPLIWMGAPLIVNGGVIGVVAVQSYLEPDLFTEKDLQVLSMVSDQIAIAINHKRMQDALLESEKKYRQLFKNAPAGIYEIDFIKNKFITVNDILCKYSGYSEKEFLSMDPLDLLALESKKKYIERLERLFSGKKTVPNVEYSIVKKNGETLTVVLNNDFIFQNGKLKGARVVVHDITQRKEAEEEKIKAQKNASENAKMALVGQVAGKMAHDFNNMLTIIMGNIELLQMDCKDAKIKKGLDLIYRETLQGRILTKNLVAFAKDQEPVQKFFRINEKIDLVINILKKNLKGIELIRKNKPGVPELFADPGMLEHIFVNMIQNSIHALSKTARPRITIQTYCLDANIWCEIEDNGCGIPKEHLKNIFVPSFTLKGNKNGTGSYTAGIKGSGYGISNAKKYIELHNGTISVTSVVGSGTKVKICLPVIKRELKIEGGVDITSK
jgi:PAS domain S-box-containing protein